MSVPRFKSPDDYSPGEHLAVLQAQRRGEPEPRFETDAYRAARADALRDAGLADEVDEAPLDQMTPDDHFQELRGSGGATR